MLTLLELAALSALTIPLFLLLRHPGLRHFRTRVPSALAIFLLGVVTYLFALVLLAVFLPAALHVLILTFGLGYVLLRWRARPTFGAARELPPGTLALLPPEPWEDQAYYKKQAARFGPVWKFSNLLRPSIGIVGLARAREFLLVHRDALRTPSLRFTHLIPGGFLRYAEPEQHGKYRSLFQNAFSSSVVRESEPFMSLLVGAELDRMVVDSARQNGVGVAPRAYLYNLVYQMMTGLFFGILPESESFGEFQHLQRIVQENHRRWTADRRVRQALAALSELVVKHASGTPSSGPGTCSFLSEILRTTPEARNNSFLVYNSVFMFEIGVLDLSGLVTWVMQMLCDHPEWGARVRAEASQQPGVKSLTATRIIMETLRLEQSEFILRRTIRPIHFHGYTIPKGWQVRVCVRESHRSADVFEHSNEFNPDRFGERQFTRDEYSPFGAHDKSCLGEHLTLTFGRIFVQELSCNYAWAATQTGPPEAGPYHWRPSSNLRVHLTRLAGTDMLERRAA